MSGRSNIPISHIKGFLLIEHHNILIHGVVIYFTVLFKASFCTFDKFWKTLSEKIDFKVQCGLKHSEKQHNFCRYKGL